MVFKYYSILHVILSNTHFNILLHIGECWFQYYLILPEHLADAQAAGRNLNLLITGMIMATHWQNH